MKQNVKQNAPFQGMRHPRSLRGGRRLARALGFAALLWTCGMMMACGWRSNDIVIPAQATAQEQYDFACQQLQEYTSAWGRGGQRNEYADRALTAFEMVIDRYPQEKKLIGRSELCIGLIWKQQGEERKALGIMESVLEKYPADDDVQVNALHEIALLLDDLGKHRQAKEYYDKLIKRYGQNQKPEYKALVIDSKSRYQKVWSGSR